MSPWSAKCSYDMCPGIPLSDPQNRFLPALGNVLAETEVKSQSPIHISWSSPLRPGNSVSTAAKLENARSS